MDALAAVIDAFVAYHVAAALLNSRPQEASCQEATPKTENRAS